MTVRVSVVVPAFNNAAYIAETIDSILHQSFTDFELLIADHASTDSTKEIIGRFAGDERVRILETKAGGGAARNWNRVSREASGEFIKLVCGDDLLDPTILEKQVAALDGEPSATLVASRRALVDSAGVTLVESRGLPGLSGLIAGRRAVRSAVRAGSNIFGEPACVLVRRNALESVGWWNAEFPYVIDEATYAQLLLIGDLVAIPEQLASFRLSSSQWSVALAQSQARQVVGFHGSLAQDNPGFLSATDLLVGNLRARITARLRRLIYIVFRSRMGR